MNRALEVMRSLIALSVGVVIFGLALAIVYGVWYLMFSAAERWCS